MPMTDGYALLSQAVFHKIDIRGHAAQEFRRCRQKASLLPVGLSAWLTYPALGLLNVLGLYLARKRLRLLIGW